MTEQLCAFPECGRRKHGLGLCHSHYQQVRRGEALRPLRKYGVPDPEYKECDTCHVTKPLDEFYARSDRANRHNQCKECVKRRLRDTYWEGPDGAETPDAPETAQNVA